MRTALLFLSLLALACEPPRHRPAVVGSPTTEPPAEVWVVARGAPVATGGSRSTDPMLLARPSGSADAPARLSPTATRVAVTLLGPLASIDRRTTYATPDGSSEGFVQLTIPRAPVRQDLGFQVGGRRIVVQVRERREAARLGGPRMVAVGADDGVVLPIGKLAAASTVELGLESVSVVPWRDGAYELTVPVVAQGAQALTVDLYGGGPLVVVASPSHAIDAEPASLDHVRVRPRSSEALDDDFVLRYRVDAREHPGAFLAEPDGDGTLVAVLLHPSERDHEPIALAHVSIDWGTMQVTDMRPAVLGPIAPGTPLVVLARVRGPATGPITVTARAGREPQTLVVGRADDAPAASLRALPTLWARAEGR